MNSRLKIGNLRFTLTALSVPAFAEGLMMQNILHFVKLIDAVNEWLGKVISFLVILMMITVVYEVIMRHLFASPTEWAFETTNFMLLWISALAAGNTLGHKEHVRIDLVYGRLKKRNQAVLDLFTSSLFFFFIILFIFHSGEMAFESVVVQEHTESVWGPPLYPQKIVLFIGGCLIFLQGIAKFISDFLTATNRDPFGEKDKRISNENMREENME